MNDVIRTSNPNNVASSQENMRRLSVDLAQARNCLSNLLFAESALDKELARREARRFLGHPSAEHAHETSDVERLRLERNVLQIDLERAQRIAALHTAEPFVVRHYTGDERPCIKGNGFDGLLVGEDREEAQAFVDWLNDRLRQEAKEPAQKTGERS